MYISNVISRFLFGLSVCSLHCIIKALSKMLFSTKKKWQYSYFSTKTFVVIHIKMIHITLIMPLLNLFKLASLKWVSTLIVDILMRCWTQHLITVCSGYYTVKALFRNQNILKISVDHSSGRSIWHYLLDQCVCTVHQ